VNYLAVRWVPRLRCVTEHRLLAERLSSPALLPIAWWVFGTVGHPRAKLSALLPG
jgi:hypothetical protein